VSAHRADKRESTWAAVPDDSDFPLENLPFGVVRLPGRTTPCVVTRIGDHVLDLSAADIEPDLCSAPSLNPLMAADAGRSVRRAAHALLTGPPQPQWLHPVDACEVLLPVEVGDYVDFYASEHHATNLGKMFRPDGDALLPNWKHLPVGYHGRAGSIVVSGTDVTRPSGLALRDNEVSFGPSRLLDIELEVGFIVGSGGSRISTDAAADHVFGVVLLNDWSARDIQSFEYQPLGPHLGKSFATTISPWVVTLDALREAGALVTNPQQDPTPSAYLQSASDNALDLELSVELNGTVVSRAGFAQMYWTFAQMVAHMTVNGASIRTGDVFGSGTVSGPTPESRGSLIELSWRGTEPLALNNGTTRTFLQDGDTVVLRGQTASLPGRTRIGFGDCTGTITPAPTPAHTPADTPAHE
jgi:fumarylacetoacetase